MPHADWLITGLEKVILPAHIKFEKQCRRKTLSPSEFYYPGETNYPNATFQGEDNVEQNSNKNSQEKLFSGLFYRVRTT